MQILYRKGHAVLVKSFVNPAVDSNWHASTDFGTRLSSTSGGCGQTSVFIAIIHLIC